MIPTILIVIALFIGYKFIKKTRNLMKSTDIAESQTLELISENKVSLPSWHSDTLLVEKFIKSTNESVSSLGYSNEFVHSFFRQQDITNKLLTMASCMEKQNCSFVEQVVGTCELAEKLAQFEMKQNNKHE